MKNLACQAAVLAVALLATGAIGHANESIGASQLGQVVSKAVEPVMKEYEVPGMAVAITIQGKRYFFDYGVASKETGKKVSNATIFEIGSVSKTFTATLAALAATRGTLSLSDSASKHMPALAGSSFDTISLLELGTYTAGGLPLQFPDKVADEAKMIEYYKSWRPTYAAGTYRLYSNPSIGLFGHLAAKSLGAPFADLMEQQLFPGLGLSNTFIRVPKDRMGDYAYGYSKANKPIRVAPGVLDAQAYGVKTTATDMISFVEANMKGDELNEALQDAVAATHKGYYKVGDMVQGLGWEMYSYPPDLDTLVAGNAPDMALKPNKASKLNPPLKPENNVLINKTGSTNGFGVYIAFVPAKNIGIAVLANRNYPIPARIKAAYQILEVLDPTLASVH